jgi:hypothetical protein
MSKARRDTVEKVQAKKKLSYDPGLLMQVLGLTGSLKQLVEARRGTVEKLQARKTILCYWPFDAGAWTNG